MARESARQHAARVLQIWDDRSERLQYDFPFVPIAAQKERLSAFPNCIVPSHWHDDVEFVAIKQGRMIYKVNGEDVPIKAGEGIFVNSRQLHFAVSCGEGSKECEYVCVQVHPTVLCTNAQFKQSFVLPVIEKARAFAFLSPDIPWQAQALNTVSAMFELRERQDEDFAPCFQQGSPITALSMAISLWALLFEHLKRDADNAAVKDSDLAAMRNMVGFIQQNYSDALSLCDIASSGAVGISKCCALFAKYFKQSPVSYLNRHRLAKGAMLLVGSDKSVTEIALALGFGGGSYFAEAFKKWTGKSPTEYRKTKGEGRH